MLAPATHQVGEVPVPLNMPQGAGSSFASSEKSIPFWGWIFKLFILRVLQIKMLHIGFSGGAILGPTGIDLSGQSISRWSF